jgi:hypothetical protein
MSFDKPLGPGDAAHQGKQGFGLELLRETHQG